LHGWTASEPVSETCIGPTYHARAEGHRDPNVGCGQAIRFVGSDAAAQVENRSEEQNEIDEGYTHQQHCADPAQARR